MSELYLMVSITERILVKKFVTLYEQHGVTLTLHTLGLGTAVNETLDALGLEKTEKAMTFGFVTEETWKIVKKALQSQLQIDAPGIGIAFTIPLSSIGGKKPLLLFTENQNFQKGEETTLKNTKYELLIVVTNLGYTGMVMDAARKANAAGGTVIHAKGIGMEGAENFLGVSLVSEREMVFIVVKSEIRNDVMRSIMENAGLTSKAQSIVFTLPVTETAGMRLLEETE